MSLRRRHHNIFFYYRGPSTKAVSPHDAHKQLEDNATKALVNVLEHSPPELARSFLGRFAPGLAVGWPPDERASYHLQGGPDSGPDGISPGQRVLLGISIDGQIDPKAAPGLPEAGTRIDAAIVPPHGGFLAIETKVVELLDPHQLERHRHYWQIPKAEDVLVRWVTVWEWARDARAKTDDRAAQLLLDQFCEYLEILGFGRWAGFREEDFAQFVDWSWDHQPILRARMRAVWERVLELMPEDQAAWLGVVEAGKLPRRETHAWAQTNRGQRGANLTLELGADELQLNLVGWNDSQASRLAKWLTSNPERAPNMELIVYERTAKGDHKHAPFWMHASHRELVRFAPVEVRSGGLAPWIETWNRTADLAWTRLAYHLRHSWTRDEALARGEHLAGDIAVLAAEALPLLRDINRWR
jgi:hypothetical protein